MGFLAPASLWLLLIIPLLLLMYFLKKQYETKTVSSTYLWERTLNQWESDRLWNKLQKNLLLFLQLLCLLFFVIALARPFLPGEELYGEHLVIIVDSSATMTAKEGENTRFVTIKSQVQQLINQLGVGHKVSVIEAQQTPVLHTSSNTDHQQVNAIIEELSVSYQQENVFTSMQLAQSLLGQENGEIHIFSDHLNKDSLDGFKLNHPIRVHNRETAIDNVSIQAFGLRQYGDKVSSIITVKNESEKSKSVTINLASGTELLHQLTENFGPNGEHTFTIEHLPVHEYYQVTIEADAYQLDNTSYAILPTASPTTIYLVGDVHPFLEHALHAANIQTVTIPKSQVNNNDEKANQDIYIVASLDEQDWPKGAKLILSPASNGTFKIGDKQDLSYKLQVDIQDPLLAYTNINQVYLSSSYPVGDLNGLTPLVSSDKQTIIAKGIYQGSPVVLLPLDLEDSDWPLHPGFPIFLTNAMDYLAEESNFLGYYHPMENIELNLTSMTEEADLETLDGHDVKEIDLRDSIITVPNEPGIYQLHEKTTNGSVIRYFVVELPSPERSVKKADSFSIDGEGQEAGNIKMERQELWHWFAILGLIVLFIEWEVYRRGVTS